MLALLSALRDLVLNPDRHQQRVVHYTAVLNERYESAGGNFDTIGSFVHELVHLESACDSYESYCVRKLWYGEPGVDAKKFKRINDAAREVIERYNQMRINHL